MSVGSRDEQSKDMNEDLSGIPLNYHCIFVLQSKKNHVIHTIVKDLPKNMEFTINNLNASNNNDIKLKVSGYFPSTKEANIVFDKKFKKLKVFLAVFHPEIEPIRLGTFDESHEKNLKKLELKPIELFLEEKYSQKEAWLEDALADYYSGNIYESFRKCVNWLDHINGKGSTMYCSIRDVLSHVVTESASKIVKKDFPEIEFEGKTIMKSSTNEKLLRKYMPELISTIQSTYNKHFLKEPTLNETIIEVPCTLWCTHCEKTVTIHIPEEATSGIRSYKTKDFNCPNCGHESLE